MVGEVDENCIDFLLACLRACTAEPAICCCEKRATRGLLDGCLLTIIIRNLACTSDGMAHARIDSIAHHLSTRQTGQDNDGNTTTRMSRKVFQLIPGVQSYDWGIQGASSSRVAQFAAATSQLNFQPQDDKPYAELWMGTHPSMPSRIILASDDRDYEPLSSYLAAHPELIGEKVTAKFSDEKPGCLPFLFKVLSVGKALSIQAHPDKTLGQRLHAQRPDVYKDPNHKPEMAIALTAFRGFCGFRPLREILDFVQAVDEFAQLVQLDQAELDKATRLTDEEKDEVEIKAILKKIFGNLMNSPAEKYEVLAANLSSRFQAGTIQGVPEEERQLVLKLSSEFPNDVGIFCTFLLNIATLQPGQALFLQANEPHAYLEGEILECMASSDNVVRAGLTPKLRDTTTLVEMCTYQSGRDRGRLEPTKWDKASGEVEAWLYDPPIEEFSVVTMKVRGEATNDGVDGPSVVLVLEGVVELDGLRLETGQLAFVGARVAVSVNSVGEAEAQLARAFVEV